MSNQAFIRKVPLLLIGATLLHAGLATAVSGFECAKIYAQGNAEAIASEKATATTVAMNVWSDTPSEFLIRLNQQLAPHERLAWMIAPELDVEHWPGPVLSIKEQSLEAAIQAYSKATGLAYRLEGRWLWIGEGSAFESELKQMQQWIIDLNSEDQAKQSTAQQNLLSLWGLKARSTQKDRFFAFLGHPDARKRRHASMAEYGSHLPAPWVKLQFLSHDEEVAEAIRKYVKSSSSLTRDPLALVLGSLIEMPEVVAALKEWDSKAAAKERVQGRWLEWERNNMYRNLMPQWLKRLGDQSTQFTENDYRAVVEETKLKIEKMKPSKDIADRPLRSILREMQRGYGMTWGPESDSALIEIAMQGPHSNMRDYAITLLGLRQGKAVQDTLEDRLSKDESPQVRRAAAMALGQMRTESGIQLLKKELFENESPIMRRNIAYALAKSRHPEAAALLIKRLESVEGAEAQALLQVLALTRQEAARDHLIQVVQDEKADLALRQSAAIALTTDRSKDSSDALIAVLKSNAPRVLRERTIKGLRPRNQAELDRKLPIMLSVLNSEKDTALQIELLLGIQMIARNLGPGDSRKVDIAETVLPIAVNQDLDSNLRIKALETFKYTENTPEVIQALQALEKTETKRVMKSFVRIAAQQAASRPAP